MVNESLSLNDAGLALLKRFEGFRPAPYVDEGGTWTIGYGHTEGVDADTAHIDTTEAQLLLEEDCAAAEACVRDMVRVPLNDNQFSALVCLVFNEGPHPLELTLGKLLGCGDYYGAADQFGRWVYVDGRIEDGLVTRRAAEKALFLA